MSAEGGIVVVGAGHSGSQAAISLRDEGYDGPLTLLSDETEFPYHRPPLSKAFLKTAGARPQLLRGENLYSERKIALRFRTAVTAIDVPRRRLRLHDGSTIAFEHLVLATGARARRLRVAGGAGGGVYYLRSLEDARILRDAIPAVRSAVVIGGGFIGLEIAATLAGLGKRVTVIETGDRLLGRAVSRLISDYVARFHEGIGVRLLLGTVISHVEGDTRVRAVVTTLGEHIEADIVIAGIGAEPNVEIACEAGIACSDGVEVDGCLRTSVPGIYAIGDCAAYRHWQSDRMSRIESVQNAVDQARHLARVIAGRQNDYREVPWFWSDQGSMKLQMVGLATAADRQVVSGAMEANGFSVYRFKGNRLLGVESINRPADHMLARKLLAADFSPDDDLIGNGVQAVKAAFESSAAYKMRGST